MNGGQEIAFLAMTKSKFHITDLFFWGNLKNNMFDLKIFDSNYLLKIMK